MRLVPAVVTPDVVRALERVKAKTGEKWTPRFVLSRCGESWYSASARLYEVKDGDAHIAWFVAERIDQGGDPWLNAWVMEGKGLERAEEIFPLIDDLARSIGAVSWRCTGRKGWAKWLKPVATVYERKVYV